MCAAVIEVAARFIQDTSGDVYKNAFFQASSIALHSLA